MLAAALPLQVLQTISATDVAAAAFEIVFEMCWRRVCKTVQPEFIVS
jgi:hypothetical protein